MARVPIGKYMVAQPQTDGSWLVGTKRQDQYLGTIEWRAEWLQFEFVPALGSAFTHDCLGAMGKFLRGQTARKLAARQAGGS